MAVDESQLIIPANLTDPVEIRRVLEEYVKSKPAGLGWEDFYPGGTGQTLIELAAGVAAFDGFQYIMSRREASADNASLPSSVREHAFNKGVLTAPSATLELRLTLSPELGQSVTVVEGELVGTIGDYELYALETKTATETFTVDVAAGFFHEVRRQVEPQKLSTWRFVTEHEFISDRLERLIVDGVDIPLASDVSGNKKYGADFMLRRTLPNETRIYVGNGALGWCNPNARELVYTYLGYDQTLSSVVNEQPRLLIARCRLVSSVKLRDPVYGVDIEDLRGIARYYPIDGVIVRDVDYSAVILKYFGGVLKDVYSYNTDPDQHVNLLVDPGKFNADTHIAQIRELVDVKRGPGIQVFYHTQQPIDGTLIELNLRVGVGSVYTATTRQRVADYLTRKTLRYQTEALTIRTQDLAVELTDEFGIKLHSTVDRTYTIPVGGFIQAFNLQVNNG